MQWWANVLYKVFGCLHVLLPQAMGNFYCLVNSKTNWFESRPLNLLLEMGGIDMHFVDFMKNIQGVSKKCNIRKWLFITSNQMSWGAWLLFLESPGFTEVTEDQKIQKRVLCWTQRCTDTVSSLALILHILLHKCYLQLCSSVSDRSKSSFLAYYDP